MYRIEPMGSVQEYLETQGIESSLISFNLWLHLNESWNRHISPTPFFKTNLKQTIFS